MNSRKTTKHALYTSFISMILCMTMLLGTTFAWFTDEVTSTNNIIKSGTLDATMEYSTDRVTWHDASKGPIFNYKLWEPGYSDMKYVKIANVGDLAFKYQLNVAPNTPRNNEGLSLADVIDVYYDIVDTSFVAPTASDKFGSLEKIGTLTQLMAETDGAAHGVLYGKNNSENKESELTACIVLHMQETAGNEYQGIWVGQSDEEKGFAVQLLATQYTYENDSFNNLFDEKAPIPMAGSVTVKKNGDVSIPAVIPNTNGESTTLGYAEIPAAAFAGDEMTLKIEEVSANGNITVSADQTARTFEITAIGLKENNTEKIRVNLYVGQGLTGVKLYHNEEEIPNSYSPYQSYIIFETTSFSPFTVVYDKEAQEEDPVVPGEDEDNDHIPDDMPQATILTGKYTEEYVNTTLHWNSGAGIPAADPEQQLEAVYIFVSPHNKEACEEYGLPVQDIADCKYADWYCDYVVSIDKDIAAGDIFLGGMYGGWGWIGFANPIDVAANEEIPLLGSVIDGSMWTYADINNFVGKFACGVAEAIGGSNNLKGATFKVMLRLTNPENADEYYNVNTVKYTFK